MPRIIFNDGEEVVFQDMNELQSLLEKEIFDEVLKRMFQDEDGFIGGGFAPVYVNATTIDLQPGRGFILDATVSADEPQYRGIDADAAIPVTLDAADLTDPRIDVIAVKSTRLVYGTDTRDFKDAILLTITPTLFDKKEQWSNDVVYVAGTPAASPSAPAVPAGYLPVAEVLVPSTTGPTSQGDVTDTRNPLNIGSNVTVDINTSLYATVTTKAAQVPVGTVTKELDEEIQKNRDDLTPRNKILNSHAEYIQRWGSAGVSFGVVGKQYIFDRWYNEQIGLGPGVAYEVRRPAVTDVPGVRFGMQVQRTVANANTTGLRHGQTLSTSDSLELQGRKVNFSFYAKKGADYSPAADALSVEIITGEGTNEDPSSTFTTQAVPLSDSVTLTGAYTRFNFTATISATATQVQARFRADHVGVAGADDSFFVTGVQLKFGEELRPYSKAGNSEGDELDMVQRFCAKSYDLLVAPGANTSTGMVSVRVSGTSFFIPIFLGSRMRVESPTITLYSSVSGATAMWRNNSTTADIAAAVGSAVSGKGFFVTIGAGIADGASISGHYLVDAEI